MVIPIQNRKTGKFEGSIGLGKTRVPTTRKQPKLIKNLKINSKSDAVNFFQLIQDKETAVNNAARVAIFAARRDKNSAAEKAAKTEQQQKLAIIHQELLAKQSEHLETHPIYGGNRWGYTFTQYDKTSASTVKGVRFVVNYGAGEPLESFGDQILVGYNKIPLKETDALWVGLGESSNIASAAWKKRAELSEAILKRGIKQSPKSEDITVLTLSIKDKTLIAKVHNQNYSDIEPIRIPLDNK